MAELFDFWNVKLLADLYTEPVIQFIMPRNCCPFSIGFIDVYRMLSTFPVKMAII